MNDYPEDMTWIEFLESKIPDGKTCFGCGNIKDEKCTIWDHKVKSESIKCKWCQENREIKNLKKSKENE